jgi:hypothetical protein
MGMITKLGYYKEPYKYIYDPKISMRILCLLVTIFLMPINIMAQDFASPEGTLGIYLNALKTGNKSQVLDCFYPKLDDFYLPQPVPIKSYKILKRIVYGQKETDDWNSQGIIPQAVLGDIDLQVEQEIYGKKRMYSYLMRNVNGEWKIISHAAWDQP